MRSMTTANISSAQRKRPLLLNPIIIGSLALLATALFTGFIWPGVQQWRAVWTIMRILLRLLPVSIWLLATAVAGGWLLLVTRLWNQS